MIHITETAAGFYMYWAAYMVCSHLYWIILIMIIIIIYVTKSQSFCSGIDIISTSAKRLIKLAVNQAEGGKV